MRPPYTCVYREMWDDKRFYLMSEIGRLVYVYLLTAPIGNGLGCFKAGINSMSEDMRIDVERFREGFEECLNGGLTKHDSSAMVVLIPKYILRNPPSNPNGVKALSKEFIKIPDCGLKDECYYAFKRLCLARKESFSDTFKESFGEPSSERLTEPLSEQPGTYSPSPSYSPSYSNPVDNSSTQNNNTSKDEVEKDNTSRVVNNSTLSPRQPLPYQGERNTPPQKVIALLVETFGEWDQIQIESAVINWMKTHGDLSLDAWGEIVQEARNVTPHGEKPKEIQVTVNKKINGWKIKAKENKKQQARSNGDYTPNTRPVYPPDCNRSMSGLKEMWVPIGMNEWQDGARTVEDNLKMCYGPRGFMSSKPKEQVEAIRKVIEAHKAAGLTMELEYEERD